MSHYSRWAQKEHMKRRRFLALLPAGLVFLILLPYVILVLGPNLDARLGMQGFYVGVINIVLGGVMMIVGGFFALWSIYAQMTLWAGHAVADDAHPGAADPGTLRLLPQPDDVGHHTGLPGIGDYGRNGVWMRHGAHPGSAAAVLSEALRGARAGGAFWRSLPEGNKQQVPFIIPRSPKKP